MNLKELKKIRDFNPHRSESGFVENGSLQRELYNALLTYNKNCEAYFENGKVKKHYTGLLISYNLPKGGSTMFGVSDILSRCPEIGKSISPTEWAMNYSDQYFMGQVKNDVFYKDMYGSGISDSRKRVKDNIGRPAPTYSPFHDYEEGGENWVYILSVYPEEGVGEEVWNNMQYDGYYSDGSPLHGGYREPRYYNSYDECYEAAMDFAVNNYYENLLKTYSDEEIGRIDIEISTKEKDGYEGDVVATLWNQHDNGRFIVE